MSQRKTLGDFDVVTGPPAASRRLPLNALPSSATPTADDAGTRAPAAAKRPAKVEKPGS